MPYFVYMLTTIRRGKLISYVGYTSNLKKRLLKHNNSKGAKFTRGSLWKIIYYEKYPNKSEAIRNEYRLKKNYKLRNKIKLKYLNK